MDLFSGGKRCGSVDRMGGEELSDWVEFSKSVSGSKSGGSFLRDRSIPKP